MLLLGASVFLLVCVLRAGDITRSGVSTSTTATSNASTSGSAVSVSAAIQRIQQNAQDRYERANQALQAMQTLQAQAQTAARATTSAYSRVAAPSVNYVGTLAPVPNNSYGVDNGLKQAAAVPKDLSNPTLGENSDLWTGATAPTASSGTDGSQTVTIQQTKQQAVLTWDSFNIGKTTTLKFDQSAGGSDVGNWIAFNKIGVTGAPSQILGNIKADGQVYIINPNGIIFGASAQVNTHALVASSLPINDNLISSGLLNNPDTQFLFSGLAIAAGSSTSAFTPTVTDVYTPSDASHTLAMKTSSTAKPVITVSTAGASPVTLTSSDYTISTSNGSMSVALTASGQAKATGENLSVTYTPLGSQYGGVEVQAGAQLTAPTTSDHSGGRIELIGPKVTNAGTISTADGQTILAAGLQVGFDAHPTVDPTLRGLDVYIGNITDPADTTSDGTAGTVTNDRRTGADGKTYAGVIEAPRGDVTLIGATVNQLGFIDSSTSVSYNGRIDILAEYNSVPNAKTYANTNLSSSTTPPPPFLPSATGVVTFGANSVTQILPELSSTERVVGTSLALSSIIDVRGLAIHLASATDTQNNTSSAVILAPSANKTVNSSGATVSQSNTRLLLTSGVTLDAGDWTTTGTSPTVQGVFERDRGQIYLDAGAAIDVSGSQNVTANVSENIVSVELRGTELADSPLQRDGALRGQTVQIDIRKTGTYNGQSWVGTPLADTSGYVGLVKRTVGELTVAGGTVELAAGTSIVLQKNAAVNVSGGWINYAGGTVQTTQVSSGGRAYDISQATPDRVYDGIVTGTSTTTDSKWGVTQSSSDPVVPGSHYEEGYVQGGSGGQIAFTAPSMVLDGQLNGTTVTGPQQRTTAATINARFASAYAPTEVAVQAIPATSSLSLNFDGQDSSLLPVAPTVPNVVFTSNSTLPAAGAFSFTDLSSDAANLKISGGRGARGVELDLSPDLVGLAGFGNLSVDVSGGSSVSGTTVAGGNITIPTGTVLTVLAGSSTLSLKGANVLVNGSIYAPGGEVDLVATDYSTTAYRATPPTEAVTVDAARGTVTLGADAVVSTAGLLVDDRPIAATDVTPPLVTSAGKVVIKGFNVTLTPGSQVDVSGGAAISSSSAISYGNAGRIEIDAGQDPNVTFLVGGNLVYDPTKVSLTGYAGAGSIGGTLAISAPLIQIGGHTLQNGGNTTNTLWLNPTDANGKLVSTDFFTTGGFTSFALNGLGTAVLDKAGQAAPYQFLPAVYVAGGTTVAATGKFVSTVIAPVASSLLATIDPTDPSRYRLGVNTVTLPEGQRTAASLSLTSKVIRVPDDKTASGLVTRGDIVLGAGSVIRTDAQTDSTKGVTVSGGTVAALGTIVVPGGTISISGAKTSGNDQSSALFADSTQALPTVDLGPSSYLSTAGKTVLSYDPLGRRIGTVLAGGNVTVAGDIVAETGAVLDVSGWSDANDAAGLLLLPSTYSSTNQSSTLSTAAYVPTVVESNAGSITLSGGIELYSNATLIGAAGGSTAKGGTLSVSSGRYYTVDAIASAADVNLVVTSGNTTLPTAYNATGVGVIGKAVNPGAVDEAGSPIAETGHFAVGTAATVTTKNVTGATVVTRGGFDYITIGDNAGIVQFTGSVTVAANRGLAVATGGLISIAPTAKETSPTVTLNAPYVALGRAFQEPASTAAKPPAAATPTSGNGTLVVNASTLIDVGDLTLKQIDQVELNVPTGEIRGDGSFSAVGNVTFNARQIYPTSEGIFTVAVYDNGNQTGTLTIASPASSALPQLPLSAGGQINLYASTIVQNGVIRAPQGTIRLGWDGTGTVDSAHTDQNTGAAVPVTKSLTVLAASTTSVSASDSTLTTIPYGVSVDGSAWLDPAGNDITLTGTPTKEISLSAANVTVQTGATLDLSGGGDLYAYQWVPGTGGSKDVLLSSGSFAVIPGYAATYAPFGRFGSATALGGDPGYVNSSLKVGDQIYLSSGSGLPAGTYTLLPARYALLPGAYLVTAKSGTPVNTTGTQADGSSLVAGYRLNGLVSLAAGTHPLYGTFEVASGTASAATTSNSTSSTTVVRSRSDYTNYSANSLFAATSTSSNSSSTFRTPIDAGQLVLEASKAIAFQGTVAAQAATGGSGGLVDISSPVDILIGQGTSSTKLVLDPTQLSGFGTESLLIGGVRQTTANGTVATISTSNITVDTATAALIGSDIILAATGQIVLKDGAILGDGGRKAVTSDPLQISGSGVLVRVGSDSEATISRSNLSSTATPTLTVGKGVTLAAASVILDSSSTTSLDPTVDFSKAGAVTLTSGRISVILDNATALRTPPDGLKGGLQLTGSALQSLQSSAAALSLLSYSSLDLYGSGTIGSTKLAKLAIHAPEIYGDGGNVTLTAKAVLLDNSANRTAPDPTSVAAGTILAGGLNINAGTITLSSNTLNVERYTNVNLTATNGVFVQSAGAFATQGAMTITAPFIAGTAAGGTSNQMVTQTISAGGALNFVAPTTKATVTPTGVIGASLALVGANVTVGSTLWLPGGVAQLRATSGDVVLESGAAVRADGTSKLFNDVTTYTNGGNVSLLADVGNVVIKQGASVNVSALSGGGSAGQISITASNGTVTVAAANYTDSSGVVLPTLDASHGNGGVIAIDVNHLTDATGVSTHSVATIENVLTQGNFRDSQSLRVRSGNLSVDSTVTAQTVSLSTDAGSIDVTGTVDASGKTGGSINLAASGSVTLESGSVLTVAAADFSSAGKGGSVTLEAGTSTNGLAPATTDTRDTTTGRFTDSSTPVVSINAGSKIDLSVASVNSSSDPNAVAAAAALGKYSGTLHIRAPQTDVSATPGAAPDVQVNPIEGTILNPSSVSIEGYKTYTPVGGYIESVEADIDADGQLFASGANAAKISSLLTAKWGGTDTATGLTKGIVLTNGGNTTTTSLLHVQPGAEIVSSTTTSTATLYSPSTSNNTITVPSGATLTLANTTIPGDTPTTNSLIFSSASTLVPIDAGSYTYSATISSTSTSWPTVGSNTSLFITTAVNANVLTLPTGVAAVVTASDGTVTNVAAGKPLPALVKGATVTFSGSGTLQSSASVTLSVTKTFVAGQSVDLPANSTVALSSSGGTVTFKASGSVTWAIAPLTYTNTLAVNVPAGGTFVIPNTTEATKGVGTNLLTFSTAVTLRAVDAGTYSVPYSLTSSGSPISLLADSSVTLTAATSAGVLASSTSGHILNSDGTMAVFGAGALPALKAGAVLSFDAGGILSSTSVSAVSISVTNSFAAGASVSLPANSTVALSTNGGNVVFGGQGTVAWSRSPLSGSSTIAVPVLASSTLTLPDTTDKTKGTTLNTYTFTSAVTIKPTDAGSYTSMVTLTEAAPLDVSSSTSIALTTSVKAGMLTMTSTTGTATLPDGTKVTITAGGTLAKDLPAGTILTFSGSGKLGTKISVTIDKTDSLVAGTATTLPANSTVTLSGTGSVTFTEDGSLNWSSQQISKTQSVAAGGSVTLSGASLISPVTFTSAVTIKPTDVGTYTAPYTLSATTSLPVVSANMTVVVTADVAPTILTSSVSGTIVLPDGSSGGTFAANARLPALTRGTTLKFNGAGTLSAAFDVSVKATNILTAGTAQDLPANATVSLSTNGGTVVFKNAGNVVWSASPDTTVAKVVTVSVPANTAYTIPSTASSTGIGTSAGIVVDSAAQVTPVDNAKVTIAYGLTTAKPLAVADSNTTVTLTADIPATTLISTVAGTIVLPDGTSGGSFSADTALPALVSGTTLQFSGAGKVTTTSNVAVKATNVLYAGATTPYDIPANSTLTLTAKGGSVLFPTGGNMTWTTTEGAPTNLNVAVSVAQNATIALPSVTVGPATGTYVATGATTVTVGGSGTATVPGTLTSATALSVSATSSVYIPSAVAANALSSNVGGTITYADGRMVDFAAGRLPALASGSTLTFKTAGSLSIDQSVQATNALGAGVSTTIPANSTAVLKSTGGTLSFSSAGTLTFANIPVSSTSAFSVALGANQTLTLPTTTGAGKGTSTNTLKVTSAATLLPADAGSYSVPTSLLAHQSMAVTATTQLALTSDLAASNLSTTAGGVITLPTGSKVSFAAGKLPAVPSGSTIAFNGAGSLSASATVLMNTVVGFAAGQNVAIPANSTVTLSTAGGQITLAQDGTLQWASVAPTTTNTISASVKAGSQLDIPSTTVAGSAASTNTLTVTAPATLTAKDAGSFTTSYSLSAGGPSVPVSTLTTLYTANTVAAGAVTSTVAGTVSFTDGRAAVAFAAGATLPALSAGATITFSGTGSLSSVQTTSFSAVTQFVAGTKTTLPANSTVSLSTNGGSLVFAQDGTINWNAAALQASSNTAGVKLATNTAVSTQTGGTTRVVTTGSNTSITLKGTGSAVGLSAGSSLFLPQGTSSTSNVLEIASAATGGSASFVTLVKATQGGTLTFPNSGTTSVQILHGGTVTHSDGTTTAIAPGATATIAQGDSVNLAVAVDTVTVTSTSAFRYSSTGASTVQIASSSAVGGSVAFTTGSGSIAGVVAGGTYTTSGATTVNAASSNGDLTLSSNWDLSTFRYGSSANATTGSGEAGYLTVRATGNLSFNYDSTKKQAASLSDGFDVSSVVGTGTTGNSKSVWTAPLLAAGSSSWSYRLVSGADLLAADTRDVQALAGANALSSGTGSLLLGSGTPALPTTSSTTRDTLLSQYFETIRTGTGDIEIYAGRDVQLLDSIATIYTAGTQASALAGFDVPVSNGATSSTAPTFLAPAYAAQYSLAGGSVTIEAQNDIAHYVQTASGLVADSSKEMPTNWLYRRGSLNALGVFDTSLAKDVASTTWWIDFSNFFEGVGALGGGNVALKAGHNISNVDAVVPTNLRMVGKDAAGNAIAPSASLATELGGGDLTVSAGANIDAGVYYVERGNGTLTAGGSIVTNASRSVITQSAAATLTSTSTTPDATTWLPTTLFLGKGDFEVEARGSVTLGPIANPFLLPQGVDNGFYYKSYFSTYALTDSVSITAVTGNVTLVDGASSTGASLYAWYTNIQGKTSNPTYSNSEPWLKLAETSTNPFATVAALAPATLRATAISGDINLVGSIVLSPSPTGTLDLLAGGAINGLTPNDVGTPTSAYDATTNPHRWFTSVLNLSDADPNQIPSITSPIGLSTMTRGLQGITQSSVILGLSSMFVESGATGGQNVVLQTQQLLHGTTVDSSGSVQPLHAEDDEPVHIYALSTTRGDISGLTLYSGKAAQISAGRDITDVGLYIQNVSPDDVTVVSAARNIIAYNPVSALRIQAQKSGNLLSAYTGLIQGTSSPNTGDIQIAGPGTLEVLAGGNIDLGRAPSAQTSSLQPGLATGIVSIGNERNPALPFQGADIIAAAGVSTVSNLAGSDLNFSALVREFLNPATASANAVRYLPELGTMLNLGASATIDQIWSAFNALPNSTSVDRDARARFLLRLFYLILRDAGRDYNDSDSANYRSYKSGFSALAALFGNTTRSGNIAMASREIKTSNGGDISLLAPAGSITVGLATDPQKSDQGILTAHGGNISMVAKNSVSVGTSRIFTLRGGNEIIWSTDGDIAAGSGSKTVFSAPPTRVLINPQSADVASDPAGLATGSGIGVLATLSTVAAGEVDLIAPIGTIDAGDAGIRSSGKLNVAALHIVNAANIQANGPTAGLPPPTPPPNLGAIAAAATATAATNSGAADLARQEASSSIQTIAPPSLVVVEVLGYGGDDDGDSAGVSDSTKS